MLDGILSEGAFETVIPVWSAGFQRVRYASGELDRMRTLTFKSRVDSLWLRELHVCIEHSAHFVCALP